MLSHASNVGIFASLVKANVPCSGCEVRASSPHHLHMSTNEELQTSQPTPPAPSDALNVLADNLKALRDTSAVFDSDAKIGKAAGMDQKTVWRIINKKNEPTTLQVSRLAAVFQMEPWKLFVPHLQPTNPPMLAAESESVRKMLKNITSTKEAIEGYLRDGGNTIPGKLP